MFIDDSPHLRSFIYNIVEFYHGIHRNPTAANSRYGLQAFVVDLCTVFHKAVYVQFAAAFLLCMFVAEDDSERVEFAENAIATLKKQEAALRGFLPLGISLEDEYGDSALAGTGRAWRLLDSSGSTMYMTSHSQIGPVVRGDREWTPYVRMLAKSKEEYVQWSFVRQPCGLYKVTTFKTPEFIRYSKGHRFVDTHSNSPSNTNGFFVEDLHSVYNVIPESETVVLFKLIVLRPTSDNPSNCHIRLVDHDFKSRDQSDVPHLFAPEPPKANVVSFLLEEVK